MMMEMKKTLFRTETFSGSGVRNFFDVFYYEVFELGNGDIFSYLSSKLPDGDSLKEDLLFYENALSEEGCIDDSPKDVFDTVSQAVQSIYGKSVQYVLWLAEKENVQKVYGVDPLSDEQMDAYHTSDVVLSDLGADGILFGYDECPQPIH